MITKIILLSFLTSSSLVLAQTNHQTQTLKGIVVDDQSKFPLAGANILILNSNPLMGITTDANGRFTLNNIPVGRQSVKVTFIGYGERTLTNVLVTVGKEVDLNIGLSQQIIQGQEVIIKSNRDLAAPTNELGAVSINSFDPETTNRFAGSRNDPARMATNYAGVSGANDNRNDIIVRGNSPLGLLWQLEGINIPNPNHYGALGTTGGPVSMINNNVLDRSDFITAAFPSQYGNAVAAVFDLKMRQPNSNKHEYLAQMGFNGFEFGAEGPIAKKTKDQKSRASYLINYRYSTLAVFNLLGLDLGLGGAVPRYQDLSFKISIPNSRRGQFSVFGMGGVSRINLLGDQIDTTRQDLFGDENLNMRSAYRTGVAGLSYQFHLNPSTYYKLTVAGSYTDQRVSNDSLSRLTRLPVRLNENQHAQTKYSINGLINKKVGVRDLFTAGFTFDWNRFSLGLVRFEQEAHAHRQVLDQNGQSRLTQGYANWQHRFNRLIIIGGLHFQHFALSESYALEPRVSLNYQFSEKGSLRLGYGEHSQMQPLTTYFVQTPIGPNLYTLTNASLGFTRSRHFVLAYSRNLPLGLRLKAETYYQGIRHAPVEPGRSSFSMLNAGASFILPDNDSLVNQGHGKNYGVELTLERVYKKGFYFLSTISVFDSRYQGSDNIWRNTAFNGRYVINLLAGREFSVGKRGNVINLDWKLAKAGGRYETPIRHEQSVIAGAAVYDHDAAFSDRLPAYFRTDLKVSYRINRRRLTHEIALDLQNFTGHKNVFTRTYNNRTQRIATQYQIGFFPVPLYRLLF